MIEVVVCLVNEVVKFDSLEFDYDVCCKLDKFKLVFILFVL